MNNIPQILDFDDVNEFLIIQARERDIMRAVAISRNQYVEDLYSYLKDHAKETDTPIDILNLVETFMT